MWLTVSVSSIGARRIIPNGKEELIFKNESLLKKKTQADLLITKMLKRLVR